MSPLQPRGLCIPGSVAAPARGSHPFPRSPAPLTPLQHGRGVTASSQRGEATSRGPWKGSLTVSAGETEAAGAGQRGPAAGLARLCPSYTWTQHLALPTPGSSYVQKGLPGLGRHLSGLKFQGKNNRDFPGRPVLKTLRFHCREA